MLCGPIREFVDCPMAMYCPYILYQTKSTHKLRCVFVSVQKPTITRDTDYCEGRTITRDTDHCSGGACCRCVGFVLECSRLSENWEISLNAQSVFPSKGSFHLSSARSKNYARDRAISLSDCSARRNELGPGSIEFTTCF